MHVTYLPTVPPSSQVMRQALFISFLLLSRGSSLLLAFSFGLGRGKGKGEKWGRGALDSLQEFGAVDLIQIWRATTRVCPYRIIHGQLPGDTLLHSICLTKIPTATGFKEDSPYFRKTLVILYTWPLKPSLHKESWFCNKNFK